MGKNNEQNSFDVFTYGLKEMSTTINNTKYTNTYLYHYNSITLSYYYYNGKEWIEDIEEVGGNDSSWYNEYTDNFGNIFYQHKFEFPDTLITYLSPFIINDSNQINEIPAKRGDKLFKCPFCKKDFPISILPNHIVSQHRNKKK